MIEIKLDYGELAMLIGMLECMVQQGHDDNGRGEELLGRFFDCWREWMDG